MARSQQGPFLMAGGAGAALLAGKGDKHLVPAATAADAGEAVVQVATVQKGPHGALDGWPPEAVFGLKPLVVDPLEGREILVHQLPQAGGTRIAGMVERQRLDRRGDHDGKGSGADTCTNVHYPALRDPSTMVCLERRNRRACRRLRGAQLVRQVFSKVENLCVDGNLIWRRRRGRRRGVLQYLDDRLWSGPAR